MFRFLNKYKLIVGLIAILTIGIAATNPSERYFEIAKNLDIFATLFQEVNAMYVDEVNPNTLMQTGIESMLLSLDPYTNYIPEDDIEDYRTQSTGQYGGIGAITSRMNDKVKVSMIMDGYSADKNGLKIGDEILKIDNIDIRELTAEESSELMRGQANTEVTLTVKRYGEEAPLELRFKREKVKISSVPYQGLINNNIGYIKLTQFTMQAGKEVERAVKDLKNQGADKIILDLRGNPGGLLMEAVNIVNIFIPKSKEVVSTIGKVTENNNTYKTLNQPIDLEIPVAVLINDGSASASEIVSGTLQDYDRGVIVGQKSFGKGLVQITRPLSYNSQLKVTTAKYYTPSGRCIQALDYSHRNKDGSVGKVPDSLKSAFETENGRIVYDGGGIDPDIEVTEEEMAPITYSLFNNGHLFDYATKYHFEHGSIPPAKEFSLTDTEYNDFVSWLKDRDYSYSTDVEYILETLESNAKDEKYYDQIAPSLEELQQKLQRSKQNDVNDFKVQIKTMLEEEIASRYYFENGTIESSFDEDKVLKKAIEILNDQEAYAGILNP